MQALKEFRTRTKSYADLINAAAMIDDGVLLNKDGSLTAAWYFQGEDLGSASPTELALQAERVNQILSRFGNGWAIHVDAVRMPSSDYPDSKFPDRTTREIDRERKAAWEKEGAHYETVQALALTYTPPLTVEASFRESLVTRDDTEAKSKESRADRILRGFKQSISDFESFMAGTVKMQRMHTTESGMDDLLRYMHYCATTKNHPIRLPAVPMYLDTIVGSEDFIGGLEPKVGGKHLRCVTIGGFPSASFPAFLDQMAYLPFPMRFSTRFIFLDPQYAAGVIDKMRKKWKQQVRGFKDQMFRTANGPVNLDALNLANDGEIALSEARSGSVRFGYYSATGIVAHENPVTADEYAREVSKILENLGFTARVETVNAVEAFLGSIPGHTVENVRRPMMHTLNLAHLMPLTTIWPGLSRNPCPFYPQPAPPLTFSATTGATPFRISLHVGDVGHTLVLGMTGGGKSTLLGLLMAQHFRYSKAQVFAFDKGYSALPLVSAAGGKHYDLASDDSKLSFAPLVEIDSDDELLWAADWIESLLVLQSTKENPLAGPDSRKAIYDALKRLRLSPKENRSLTEFLSGLQMAGEQGRAVKNAIAQYTREGPGGQLLDSQEDGLSGEVSPFQVFEMEHLLDKKETLVVPVLLYIFHRIEKSLKGQPTLIILDEAWVALRNAVFAEKIREWLKVLRRANAAVIFATQSLTDIIDSPLKSVLLESCPTKILLANPEARNEIGARAYQQIGLTATQAGIVARMAPKREYYYLSPLGKRVFNLGLGPVALSFVGASGKEDIAKVRELIAEHGNMWPARWLESRGLHDAAKHWVS